MIPPDFNPTLQLSKTPARKKIRKTPGRPMQACMWGEQEEGNPPLIPLLTPSPSACTALALARARAKDRCTRVCVCVYTRVYIHTHSVHKNGLRQVARLLAEREREREGGRGWIGGCSGTLWRARRRQIPHTHTTALLYLRPEREREGEAATWLPDRPDAAAAAAMHIRPVSVYISIYIYASPR